ncbi:MAG: hypothetical protein ACP5OG_05440 [Candidatus Nanoarchaeia archaeon]
MIINTRKFNINITLNWEEINILNNGGIIGDRYNGESKIEIQKVTNQKPYAKLNRQSLDFMVFVSQEALKDCRIIYSVYNKKLGNLYMPNIPGDRLNPKIKINYPGSLQIIDITKYFHDSKE